MTRFMVTGGAGFIGSALVNRLARDANAEVSVYDDYSRGTGSRLPQDANVEVVRGAVDDYESLLTCLQEHRPQVVFHLAAMHYIPECEAKPYETIKRNVLGTESLLQACAEAGSVRQVVFTSSAAVYAASDDAESETSALGPMDIYGISKTAGEQLIEYFAPQKGIQCVMARLFNVYGPGDTNPHVIPEILAQVRAGQTEIEVGNTHTRRDYIYVDDVAAALQTLSQGEYSQPTEVYNVGTGIDWTVSDIISMVAEASGLPVHECVREERMRPVDRPRLLADARKLKKLGWQPQVSFAEGLKLTLASLQEE